MKTIIVPIDFSPTSDNAVDYAIALAKETTSNILLFHVYQVPLSVTDAPIILLSVEDLKKNADARMEKARQAIATRAGSVQIAAEALMGNTMDELEAVCKRISPFVVVMGTKGDSKVERMFFGSTTLSAIRHLSSPIIIIPPQKTYSTLKRIGFACDFKQVVSTSPLQLIKDFVKEFNADLFVLNVERVSSEFRADESKEFNLLNEALSDLGPSFEFIENENIEAGIEKFAQMNHLDLVITIPKRHKLLDGLFKKSHSRELVFHFELPIMCVHE